MIKIAPSLLSADFSNLAKDISIVEASGAEYLHIDVMDGIFVPNISIGPVVIKSIRPNSDMIFDVHLMITKPERYIDNFIEAGADYITIHLEATDNVDEVIDYIKSRSIKAAVSIKPKTPASDIEYLINKLDMVLVMSVEPGFGGQSFIPESLDKIVQIRKLIDKHNPLCELEVDGGINAQNINDVVKAGANVIVAGSAVFNAPNPAEAVKELRKNAI